jgi:RND family efflux transporter MFP subunit
MSETTVAGKPDHSHATPVSRRPVKSLLVLAVALILVGVVIFRGIAERIQTAAAVKQETIELAVPDVPVAHPKLGAMENEVILPGNIQAFIDSPVSARANGYLKKWYSDIGAHVKAGQPLAEIDSPELDQQVHQVQAALEQSKAALDQALANLQQGKANEQLASVTAKRWANLVAKGVVSKQENDQYQMQYQAQVANVSALEKAVAAARSNVQSAEANLSRLRDLQAFEIVRAPFDGVITARNTDIGALVNTGMPAQELFHIASVAKLRVYVNVPQIYSQSTVPGLSADLTLAEFPGRHFRGKIVRNAESMDVATRTLLTEVDVDNPTGELKPGAYAQVHLTLPASVPSVIVPVGAVLFRSEGLRVAVIRDGNKVELRQVIVGKDYGTEVEVVSGLRPSDLVVMNPPDSLTSGTVVHPIPASEGPKR